MRGVTITSLLCVAALASGCSPQSAPQDSKPGATPAAATASGAAAERAPATQSPPSAPGAGATSAPAASGGAAAPQGSAPLAPETAPATAPAEEFREITIPDGTVLTVVLDSSHASDTSKVEDRVEGRLAAPVAVRGTEVLAKDAAVSGRVIDVKPSGKVKGRASLALRFTAIEGRDGQTTEMRSASVSRLAKSAKKRDTATIAGSAAGGAIVGAIIGGGKGAAVGAAVGGAGGTGVVLATKGEEVRLSAGQTLKVRLTAPLTVRVPAPR